MIIFFSFLSALTSGSALFSSSSISFKRSTSQHSREDPPSSDSSSQLSLCYPGGAPECKTQLDALSCTQQKATDIYCTPNGCCSVVDLELNEKVYGGGVPPLDESYAKVEESTPCGETTAECEFSQARLMLLTDWFKIIMELFNWNGLTVCYRQHFKGYTTGSS